MTQAQILRRLKRSHWRSLEHLLKRAYRAGLDEGLARAHGAGRRGRTIRADSTVEGLLRQIQLHFGLKRYGFEVRVVHPVSGRRIPAHDQLLQHLRGERP
ncbi:MAG TPA: hypothetical protein VID50_09000 [Candidatus Eisenbacteria bacterium]|jgi:hypothetical protein